MSDRFEDLLKEAASRYVELEGDRLLRESALYTSASIDRILRDIRRRRRLGHVRRAAVIGLPLAACLLIAALVARPFGVPAEKGGALSGAPPSAAGAPSPTASRRVEITRLSAKLPGDCTLTGTDYDRERTIYHITNTRGNDIVLVAERSDAAVEADGFNRLSINGEDAYLLLRPEYSVLLAQTGGIRYTLTSEFDAGDLINIARAVL